MLSTSRNSYISGFAKAASPRNITASPWPGSATRLVPKYLAPAVGRVQVAWPYRAPLQIAELVEYEQRVVAGAAEVTVVGAPLLLAISRALARIHVEYDDPRRAPPVHGVDPLAR